MNFMQQDISVEFRWNGEVVINQETKGDANPLSKIEKFRAYLLKIRLM
jgi:hypothetical protein